MKAEQITEVVAYHGEGPVWSPTWGGLRWVDMLAGDVLGLTADASISRTHVGKIAAVVRPRRTGGAIVAVEHGFAVTDGDLADLRPLPDIISAANIRFNEGGCDPDGRFYCGSMSYDGTARAGAFYRMDIDGAVTMIYDSVTTSNGFGFSPDGSLAYYIDTRTQRIDVCDYADGALTSRRPWVQVPAETGGPDGLAVDSEGCVWVALYRGSAVHRYRPDGRLDGVVEVPARLVTACTFGGPDLDELFITTSRQGLEPGAEPLAGALFSVRPGVRGLPVLPYAG